LFAENEETKQVREETMEKILKMADVKKQIRDKELWEADHEDEVMERVIKVEKAVDKIDSFFIEEASDEEIVEAPKEVERRAVLRDGRVPKLAKNFEKLQQEKIEKQRRREGWYDDPIPEPVKPFVSTIEKPLKMRPNKRDYAQSTSKNPVAADKVNVMF
jgi:hypothetical protein